MSVACILWRVADAPHISSVAILSVPDMVSRLMKAVRQAFFVAHRKVTYVLTIAVAWSVAPAVCCATNQHYNSGAIHLPDSASPTALDK